MRIATLSLLCLLCLPAIAAEKQLLWGDTHLHTAYSSDAYITGNFDADPDTAYRYARGLPVLHPYHRGRVQIKTPLDFLVVSDHAELMGVIREIHREGVNTDGLDLWASIKARFAGWVLNRALDNGTARELFRQVLPRPDDPREAAAKADIGGNAQLLPPMRDAQIDAWRHITNSADEYNDPGNFSALIGWEWSSIPGGANLHRVVITDGNAEQSQRFQPFSLIDSAYPEDLWHWLRLTSAMTGANFVAIPHNSNISKGRMFNDRRLRGTPFDADYIALRMQWEPLVEITQIKGDSETHSDLSPTDDFADFAQFPYYLQSGYSPYQAAPGDYVRSALKRGLSLEREFGQNPYQFGVIGSTDAHTALAGAEEDNFWGKLAFDSIPENKTSRWGEARSPRGWTMSAAGLAAVWAEKNTREAILAAMRRREVYATSGPRIRLQFYAGAGLAAVNLASANLYRKATARGVPMGGELKGLSASPTFLVLADKDPATANLDRIQIVKGWLDAAGEQHERLFNVAWSDNRALRADGSLPLVGNTVDTRSGRYQNSIGAAQLTAAWRDPDFVAGQSAFYYVRALQIPTPRHSLLDAIALGLEHAEDYPDTIQERAYSSPIWLSP